MLYNTVKKINETIKKDGNVKTLLNEFKNHLDASPALLLEYEIQAKVKNVAGKLNLKETFEVIKYLKFKYANAINSAKYDFLAKKKLAESFGIDINKVVSTEYDRIINFDDKKLNESILKNILLNKDIVNDMKVEKEALSETYKDILKYKDKVTLVEKMRMINAMSKGLNESDNRMISESLISLQKKLNKDFAGSVNKIYKLQVLTKKMFKESINSMLTEEPNYDEIENMLDKPYSGKKIKLGDVGYLKNIVIENTERENGPFVINFSLDCYLLNIDYTDRVIELKDLLDKLYKTKAVLINKLIYQAGFDYFNLNGTKYDVSLPRYIDNVNFKKYGYKTTARFEIILFIKKPLDKNTVVKDFTVIFQKFSDYLKTYIGELLDNTVQQELFKGQEMGRKKKYSKDNMRKKYKSTFKNDISTEEDDDYAYGVVGDIEDDNWLDRYTK